MVCRLGLNFYGPTNSSKRDKILNGNLFCQVFLLCSLSQCHCFLPLNEESRVISSYIATSLASYMAWKHKATKGETVIIPRVAI